MTKASGSIDLKSLKIAGESASKYITYIDADTGIRVHNSEDSDNYLQINSDGIDVNKDGKSISKFGETIRIGSDDDNSSKIIASSEDFNIITDSQSIAFSVATSDIIKEKITAIYGGLNLSPNNTVTLLLGSGFDNLPTGTECTINFTNNIIKYIRRKNIYTYQTHSKNSYVFNFTKGTSVTRKTETVKFVKTERTSLISSDIEYLPVYFSYNDINKTILIETPNFYSPSTEQTTYYLNKLSIDNGKAITVDYIPSIKIYGSLETQGVLLRNTPEHSSNSYMFVYGGNVISESTLSNVKTWTAKVSGDAYFALDSNPLPKIYLYTGTHWVDTSTTQLYLNINGTGAKPVYSNGSIVSGSNDPISVISYVGLYYDGEKYNVFHNVSYGSDTDGGLAYAVAKAGFYESVYYKEDI